MKELLDKLGQADPAAWDRYRPMTLYQAWSEFCYAARNALWAYSPETIFFAGILIGIICSLLAGLIILPQNLL